MAAAETRITVLIAALNEEEPIGGVVREVLAASWRPLLRECLVVNNGSTDRTAEVARAAGARVVEQPVRGYGRALAAGVAHADPASDILVFLDGDGSDNPEEVPLLLNPVLEGRIDFAIASRTRGKREPGSMLPSQIFAGRLAGAAMRLLYGVRYSDMGSMRVITRRAFESLHMQEETYGWNLEMQMKAARAGLRILEVPVVCRRRRGGVSKVAGSVSGSIKAAYRILLVLTRIAFSGRRAS